METIIFHSETMAESAEEGYATATEIADWLVRTLDMPFRQAHHVTGRIVKMAEGKKCRLGALSLSEMQSIEPAITDDLYQYLDPATAIRSRVKNNSK